MSSHKASSRLCGQCDMCPAGQPHIWKAQVASRTRGTKCPYCSNIRVYLHNSLSTIAPESSKYWNYTKNGKAPEQVVAGSHFKAEWQCPDCKFEWRASIMQRARKGAGSKCSAKNRTQQAQPTFAAAQPAELAEWDHERTNAEGLYPHKITLGSNKLVHWICLCCPEGKPHRWTAMPDSRIRKSRGCPCWQASLCLQLSGVFVFIYRC